MNVLRREARGSGFEQEGALVERWYCYRPTQDMLITFLKKSNLSA